MPECADLNQMQVSNPGDIKTSRGSLLTKGALQ